MDSRRLSCILATCPRELDGGGKSMARGRATDRARASTYVYIYYWVL